MAVSRFNRGDASGSTQVPIEPRRLRSPREIPFRLDERFLYVRAVGNITEDVHRQIPTHCGGDCISVARRSRLCCSIRSTQSCSSRFSVTPRAPTISSCSLCQCSVPTSSPAYTFWVTNTSSKMAIIQELARPCPVLKHHRRAATTRSDDDVRRADGREPLLLQYRNRIPIGQRTQFVGQYCFAASILGLHQRELTEGRPTSSPSSWDSLTMAWFRRTWAFRCPPPCRQFRDQSRSGQPPCKVHRRG
jgi:hypothetical protein